MVSCSQHQQWQKIQQNYKCCKATTNSLPIYTKFCLETLEMLSSRQSVSMLCFPWPIKEHKEQLLNLLMANKVFLMNGFKLLTDFATAITNNFLSEVQLVDFGQGAVAVNAINSWVREKTHGKISGLMQKESFNNLTRMVLVNAIYFKGNWKYQFNKYNTKTKLFYLNDVNSVHVQMMHVKRKFSYKFDFTLDAQILEMRYVNEDLSMIIILPNKRNGIDDLEKKLATANLTEITRGMWPTEVDVALPKFKIEQTIDLKDALVKLGLGEIFHVGANFKGMIEMYTYENLYVSEVVQKAFIEVNEEGAEAAAVTAVTMMMFGSAGPPPRPTLFIADHPFVFLLSSCHKFQTNILFTGRVSNPNF